MGESPGLAEEQQRALERLSAIPALAGYYLAGGSAVAYHLGHRRSRDVDLFSPGGGADLDRVADAVTATGQDARMLGRTDAALRLVVCGAAVDVVDYAHPLLEPPVSSELGFPVAGLLDLATMKLAAITRRGLRRDFWDLHAILASGLTLAAAVDAYRRRFAVAAADLYHVLRALTYFVDAERDPLPDGLTLGHWQRIKATFEREAPRLLGA